MDFVIESVLFLALIFVAFGAFALLAGVFEFIWTILERRGDRRELLPDPNPRTVVRRRGWQVPL